MLVTSPQLLAEAQDVLTRSEIMTFTGLSFEEPHEFLQEIEMRAYVTRGDYGVETITTDPDDNIVLATALEGQATHMGGRVPPSCG